MIDDASLRNLVIEAKIAAESVRAGIEAMRDRPDAAQLPLLLHLATQLCEALTALEGALDDEK